MVAQQTLAVWSIEKASLSPTPTWRAESQHMREAGRPGLPWPEPSLLLSLPLPFPTSCITDSFLNTPQCLVQFLAHLLCPGAVSGKAHNRKLVRCSHMPLGASTLVSISGAISPFPCRLFKDRSRIPKSCMKVKVLVNQSCPTLGDPTDYSPPGSTVHGILQARILEWLAIPFFKGSS